MKAFVRAALYFHTIRHLKPVQVWSRAIKRVRWSRPDLRVAPPLREVRNQWQPPARRRSSMLSPRHFRFLNEDGALGDGKSWELPGRSKLWLYNLHYFDDLNAAGAADRVEWHSALIARWIAENAPGSVTGWDPYPTSLRLVNWIKWALAGNDLSSAARDSMAVQARWLRGNVETDLLGNHLFANAKALVFAGSYFEGPEAAEWLQYGLRILRREIPEQILPDGGHFERSTMYQALILEDLLDLLNLTRSSPTPFLPWASSISDWREVVGRMGRWLSTMCHPDGEIAFFNDAAIGIAPKPAELVDYAVRLGVSWQNESDDGVVWLEQSGYIRAQRAGAVLIADVAPIGPDYLPGHAHADTLTFELSVHGQRVVVNSGTSGYGLGEQRERDRGTAAHNTVEVEGQNSSEVWGGFRVGRRARIIHVGVRDAEDAIHIEAAHDGYRRLRRGAVHHRVWKLSGNGLDVVDRLDGRAQTATAWIHFHPKVTLNYDHELIRGFARWEGGAVRWAVDACKPSTVDSTWHPEFGLSVRSSALACRFGGSEQLSSCRMLMSWD